MARSRLAWIPAFPLVGFLTLLVRGPNVGASPRAGYLATAMVFAVVDRDGRGGVLRPTVSRSPEVPVRKPSTLFSWVPVGDLQIDMAFLADPLIDSTMCLFVLGIGGLIHLFAVGYMHGDPKFSKFFLYLSLFIFSMTLLVLGENLLVTFLGWEGVGTCSYLLISFWHTRESAATAGKKAFITNRVGDFGVMLAMFLAFESVGSVGYAAIERQCGRGHNDSAPQRRQAIAMHCCLLGATVGKSAQLPLYVWLPDAMAGPTPVSALIHAATMVTGRRVPYWCGSTRSLRCCRRLGADARLPGPAAITALFAATIALTLRTTSRRCWPTPRCPSSAYMMLAVGTGAYVAAIFHMVTHAMFKALLFLGSGSVIHGMHDEQDMRKMGRRSASSCRSPRATFIVGWLAIAGVPPFAGFLVERRDPAVHALAESVRRCTSSASRPQSADRLLHDAAGDDGFLRRAEVGLSRECRRSRSPRGG